MNYLKLTLSVAAGCLLAYSVIALHHWAWEESYLPAFWFISAGIALNAAAIWFWNRSGRSLRSLLSSRSAKWVGSFAAALLVCYLIGVAVHLR